MNIFFGDSITEGANCITPFTQLIPFSLNKGVSGTTIGEYSIYPVDGYSLMRKYDCSEIREADTVFLEYGINDVTAIMCDFITLQKVIVSFVKVLDGIKQVTNADIKFLSIAEPYSVIINKYAALQCDYLSNNYFKEYDILFPASYWADMYNQFIKAVSKRLPIIPMIEDAKFFDFEAECMSDDNLHPNDKGHYIIAETIKKYI